jgi:hypothetical protein
MPLACLPKVDQVSLLLMLHFVRSVECPKHPVGTANTHRIGSSRIQHVITAATSAIYHGFRFRADEERNSSRFVVGRCGEAIAELVSMLAEMNCPLNWTRESIY